MISNQVLTFDSYGISGHPNHRAIPEGVKFMINNLNSILSTVPRLFSLISASLLTKYTGFASLAIGGLPNRVVNRDSDAIPFSCQASKVYDNTYGYDGT